MDKKRVPPLNNPWAIWRWPIEDMFLWGCVLLGLFFFGMGLLIALADQM